MKITQNNGLTATHEWTAEPDERRQGTRIPFQNAESGTFPSADQGRENVAVEDLSFAGISLRVADASGLSVGQQLDIVIAKRSMAVVIRYIVKVREGDHRVGMEFVAPKSREVRAAIEELLDM